MLRKIWDGNPREDESLGRGVRRFLVVVVPLTYAIAALVWFLTH